MKKSSIKNIATVAGFLLMGVALILSNISSCGDSESVAGKVVDMVDKEIQTSREADLQAKVNSLEAEVYQLRTQPPEVKWKTKIVKIPATPEVITKEDSSKIAAMREDFNEQLEMAVAEAEFWQGTVDLINQEGAEAIELEMPIREYTGKQMNLSGDIRVDWKMTTTGSLDDYSFKITDNVRRRGNNNVGAAFGVIHDFKTNDTFTPFMVDYGRKWWKVGGLWATQKDKTIYGAYAGVSFNF